MDFHVPRGVGTVIQITLGVRVHQIDGRRHFLMVQSQHGEHTFNAARPPQQVAGHGLGGTDQHFVRVIAQGRLDGLGFVDVPQRRGGAVGVQIIDLIGIDTRIAHGVDHGAARAVHAGCCHMACVRAHAVAGQFGVNFGTTGLGVFVLFQHQHTRTFAQYKTIAVLVPGTRCGRGVVIAGGQSAHGRKAPHAQWRHTGF